MIKISKFFLYSLAILLILQGCNDEEDNVSSPPDNAPIENNENTTSDGTNEQNEDLFNFSSFDLDIDYEGNKTFDVDYENENDGMEAEIKDTVNDESLSGDEAFEKLRPIFENMTFDMDTENDSVISEVLNAFNLNNDYTQFELEVRFSDGTEKEYNQ